MTNLNIELKPVEVDEISAVTAVRWLNAEKGPVLVASSLKSGLASQMDSTLVFTAVSPPRGELLRVRQSVPSIPDWDVAWDDDQSGPAFVYTDAGGAINALMLHRKTHISAVATEGSRFESYHRPRFVKHAAKLPLLAIRSENEPIFFNGIVDSGYSRHVALQKCESALLVFYKDGYFLFYKTAAPGAPRGNLISRGILHQVELDRDLKPRAAATKPFGDMPIFEFDVELAGSRSAILATTESGTWLKTGDIIHNFVEPKPQSMTSPSILRVGSQMYIALLEGAMSRDVRILTAEAPAP